MEMPTPRLLQHAREARRRELAALVGIKDFGSAKPCQAFFRRLEPLRVSSSVTFVVSVSTTPSTAICRPCVAGDTGVQTLPE
jgi:hypothetical protein